MKTRQRWRVAVVVAIGGAATGAAAPAPVQRKFLPPRAHDDNAGVLPIQPIDSAAWTGSRR